MTQRTYIQRMKDHLWGALGSVLVHLLLVYLLVTFVQIMRTKEKSDMRVELLAPEPGIVLEPDPRDDAPEVVNKPAEPTKGIFRERDDIRSIFKNSIFNVDPVDTLEVDMPDTRSVVVDWKLINTGRDVDEGLGEHAPDGGAETGPAAVRALEWLKANQRADGSWGRPGLTGLGVLTFLAHNEIPGSPIYGPTVERAIRHLISIQQEDGRFTSTTDHAMVYDHAIAAYAISDAFKMTRNPVLKGVMERAVQPIIDGQQAGGGWDYGYKKNSGRNDSSVNGWQVQALKSALLAKAKNPGLREALQRASVGLLANQDPQSGGFGYTTAAANRPSTTAVAILSLQLTGYAKSPEVRAGQRQLRKYACSWADAVRHQEAWALYTWYYATQAHFHEGGGNWRRWNPQIAASLVH